MIRVNLLEGTAEHRVAVQKTKVAARRGQQIFMVVSALALCLVALGVDHLWTNNAHASAKSELDREQKMADQLKADVDRKAQLETQIKEIDDRSKVIKDLRASQETPVPMLSAINDRMPGAGSDFTIEQVKQTSGTKEKPGALHIVGSSTDQQIIASFAQRLEKSDGLFANLSLSIERVKDEKRGREREKEKEKEKEPGKEGKEGKEGEDDDTPSRYKFTIDCDYNKPPKSN
jgi:Tfp pilus assembly protein PilN